jgi:hypothetical protein
MKTSYRRTLRRVATVMSLVVAGVAGAGAATASAASAELSIEPTGLFNQYHVSVSGSVRTPPPGSYVEIRLWGDDTFNDDFLLGPRQSGIIANRFYADDFYVYRGVLNEDDIGDDEIYAGVRVYQADGKQIDSVESNRVVHSY